MNGINNFKSNVKGIDWFFVNLSEVGLKRSDLITKLPKFMEFMERFNCTPSELLNILEELCVLDRDLFEYSIYGNILAKEKGVYTEKWVQYYGGGGRRVTTDYDVYIRSNIYVDLTLNKVAEKLVIKTFPFLVSSPFMKTKRRFSEKVNKLPTDPNTKVSDVLYIMGMESSKITVKELIDLYTNTDYKDSIIICPDWSVYSNGSIYINIEKKDGYCVYTTFRELLNKDWEAIENKNVSSLCLYDEKDNLIKGKWYKGKQKNAPYFNNEKVKYLKKCIMAHKVKC